MIRRAPKYWRTRGIGARLLYPLALIFGAIVRARRACYRMGLLRVRHLPVPVVVVGNIAMGGTGKTPLTIWLARRLIENGRRPGIVSRGYGAALDRPRRVRVDDDPTVVGDEPLLLARHSGCPVWVGAARAKVATVLISEEGDCDVVIADDGLQHYALGRTVEIAVTAAEVEGNGWLLPAGPLREPPGRLDEVDAVVAHGEAPAHAPADGVPHFAMRLSGGHFMRLADWRDKRLASELPRRRWHAVAGIGSPARFFASLRGLGLDFTAHEFADHHRYEAGDFAFVAEGEGVLMTEKDAVKCAALAPAETWVLPVEAEVVPDLATLIMEKIGGRPSA